MQVLPSWDTYSEPGGCTLPRVLLCHRYDVTEVFLKQTTPNIKFLEYHPADISLP